MTNRVSFNLCNVGVFTAVFTQIVLSCIWIQNFEGLCGLQILSRPCLVLLTRVALSKHYQLFEEDPVLCS
jgi:hypothetical protein